MATKQTTAVNSAQDFENLFSPDVEISTPVKQTIDEWQPSAAKGKNNVYQAIIRFVPWWKDPVHGSIKDKWSIWLVDPITERGKSIDCPSSVGKPSPIQDIYWKLKKSDNVIMQQNAEKFSRKHAYASLVQVIKDENRKEDEGKIFIWKYGVKIFEKINAELNPVIGEKEKPFDILSGKAFAVVITKVSGFNNYDQSKFVDKRIPLCIPSAEGKLVPITEKTDKKMVFEWLKENSPDLNKFDYKEWDQETYDYVNHVITTVTGQSLVSNNTANVVNSQKATPTNKPQQNSVTSKSGITSTDLSLDSLGSDNSLDELEDLNLPSINSIDGIPGDLDDIYKTA